MARWFDRLRSNRISGFPRSSNGASSLHLRWNLDGSFDAVSIDLTVLDPPTVPRLHFWALQTDFRSADGAPAGAAHTGLQWHPGHPGSTAVNWGGYGPGGSELDGSDSPLPSATSNRNTRDYPWRPGCTYRLTVELAGAVRSGLWAWRATVTDLAEGRSSTVRDLHAPAERIRSVTVWSEVFARCDDPSSAVQWAGPRAVEHTGTTVRPSAARLNYQSAADGGCANTDSYPSGAGIAQRTNCERRHAQSSWLGWPDARPD